MSSDLGNEYVRIARAYQPEGIEEARITKHSAKKDISIPVKSYSASKISFFFPCMVSPLWNTGKIEFYDKDIKQTVVWDRAASKIAYDDGPSLGMVLKRHLMSLS